MRCSPGTIFVLYYLLYINDIAETSNCNTILYADGITLNISQKKIIKSTKSCK